MVNLSILDLGFAVIMYLSFLDIFDLFFRFAIIGQFFLVSVIYLAKNITLKSQLVITLMICASAYLLLTPQIPNHHYGYFRGVLLFFTDLMPYVLWFYVCSLLDDDFHPKNWHIAIQTSLIAALLWLLYFFIYLQGNGAFHQINHAIEAVVLVHIIYLVLKDINDDLIDKRRKIRMFIVLLTTFYGSILVLFELTKGDFVHTSIFSLTNSTLIFIGTNIFYLVLLKQYKSQQDVYNINTVEPEKTKNNHPKTANLFQVELDKLNLFIEEKKFTETNLTIKKLAIILVIPEHQLRELINQELGFKNFSSFLNSHRIPAACAQFKDLNNIRKPILSIALDLGYGSIGPFNRAFKDIMGMTPTEYKKQCS